MFMLMLIILGGVGHKYQRVQHKNSSIGECKETSV